MLYVTLDSPRLLRLKQANPTVPTPTSSAPAPGA